MVVTTGTREFHQFIRRVHRRFVVLRVLERGGLGVLFSCGAAIPLLAISIALGRPTMPLAAACLIVGALAGLVWGLLTRPTALQAAMEADRQLGWADLLGSALSTRHGTDDPWAQAVALAADARCRDAAAGAVILNRLGARAWGGIGLASALVVVLAMLPTYSTSMEAQQNSPASQREAMSLRSENQSTAAWTGSSRRTNAQAEPEDASGNRASEEPVSEDHSPGNRERAPRSDKSGENAGASDSHGAGSSHTDVKEPGSLAQSHESTGASEANPRGTPAAGSGQKSNAADGPTGSQSGMASQNSSSTATPPWQSSDWAKNVSRAHQALESGEIPDAYRDVVRGYFDRQ